MNRLDTILVAVIKVKKAHRVNDRATVRALIAPETNLIIDRQPLQNLIYSITSVQVNNTCVKQVALYLLS